MESQQLNVLEAPRGDVGFELFSIRAIANEYEAEVVAGLEPLGDVDHEGQTVRQAERADIPDRKVFREVIFLQELDILGLGVEPDRPEWGAMLFQGRKDIAISPWLAVFSGSAITLAVLAFSLLGDGIRDALDPRSQ